MTDANETQPDALVTVNVYVPADSDEMVELVPVPVVVIPPGVLVNVHVSGAGKPFSTTLPVANVYVGWVIVPTVGAVGVVGWAVIVTVDPVETHPAAFFAVTV